MYGSSGKKQSKKKKKLHDCITSLQKSKQSVHDIGFIPVGNGYNNTPHHGMTRIISEKGDSVQGFARLESPKRRTTQMTLKI